MSRKRSKPSSALVVLILISAVGLWIFDAYRQGNFGSFGHPAEAGENADAPPSQENGPTRTGPFETYTGCTLAADRGNDGDSFRVKLPDGKAEVIRLYFVDTPERDFKSYGGGRNNHERIAKQAEDLGGITPQQAVVIGKKAKGFTLSILAEAPFKLHTEWDSPFNDRRYHGFIELNYGGEKRFLHELLVEKGYARIHTKGAPMPDGTPERKQEDLLFKLQRAAKSAKAGAWGL